MPHREVYEEVKAITRKLDRVIVSFLDVEEPREFPCKNNFVIVRRGIKMVAPAATLLEGDKIVTLREVV